MNGQESGRFFKKKLRKKLLLVWAHILETRHARESGHPRLSCLHIANSHDPATNLFLIAHP
jgi:hypothetical protein